MATDSSVRGINRIVDILNCFSLEEPVQNLTAISEKIGLAKSTTHRLVTALVSQGVLMRDVYGRGYRLGYQLLYWGTVAQAALDLRAEAHPILTSLARSLDETAILTVRDGVRGLYLDIVESSQPVRLSMQVGQRLHLNAGASSKVLFAFLPEEEIEHMLATTELAPVMPNAFIDRIALREEFVAIRKRGYAISYEETDRGAMGVAAPVYDRTGQPVAGIGIAAPITRVPPERVPSIAPLVIDASLQLSEHLGAPNIRGKRRA